MSLKIEYLAIYRRTDSFCDSTASFLRLLQVDSKIQIIQGLVKYEGIPSCSLQVSGGEVPGRQQRYFHLKLECTDDPEKEPTSIDRLTSVLKSIRRIVAQSEGEVETLRDDLSSYYAHKCYPIIHEIENLMRRLITNFMLVNVGREWTTEALPRDVVNAMKKTERKNGSEYLNALYQVDFNHLADALFDPYAKRAVKDLFTKIADTKGTLEAAELDNFLPVSNWQRYFAPIVDCDDDYLRKRWNELYKLRCKVAHNALLTRQDHDRLTKLVGDVRPKLIEAIGKLPRVTVPSEDAERVAESAIQAVHSSLGEFLTTWHAVEALLARRLAAQGEPSQRTLTGSEMVRRRVMTSAQARLFEEVRQIRNAIVHGGTIDMPAEVLRDCTAKVKRVLDSLEDGGCVDHLRGLAEDAREELIMELLDHAQYDLIGNEHITKLLAETNADDWEVSSLTISDVSFDEINNTCHVVFSFTASSEQDEDRMHLGTELRGQANAVIKGDGAVHFREIEASIVHSTERPSN